MLSKLEQKLINVRVWLNRVALVKQRPPDDFERSSNYQLYRDRLTSLCDSLPGYLERLNYNELSATFGGSIPGEFLAKLSNIQRAS